VRIGDIRLIFIFAGVVVGLACQKTIERKKLVCGKVEETK
jgi:hypothetical protein